MLHVLGVHHLFDQNCLIGTGIMVYTFCPKWHVGVVVVFIQCPYYFHEKIKYNNYD